MLEFHPPHVCVNATNTNICITAGDRALEHAGVELEQQEGIVIPLLLLMAATTAKVKKLSTSPAVPSHVHQKILTLG